MTNGCCLALHHLTAGAGTIPRHAADRGIGVIPDVAVRRNIHPGVRFIALRGAPQSPVALAFLPRARNAELRRFVEAAVANATGSGA